MSETIEGVTLVPQDSRAYLNSKQIEHYKNWRKRFIRWLTHEGKNPDKAEGYAAETVERTAYRADFFMRYVWDENDSYTLQIEPDDASRMNSQPT